MIKHCILYRIGRDLGLARCYGLAANLRWISVQSRGSDRLSSAGGKPGTCDGLVSSPGGVIDSHLLGVTCDGLMSCPEGVTDSHPLDITKTGDKRPPYELLVSGKDMSFSYPMELPLTADQQRV